MLDEKLLKEYLLEICDLVEEVLDLGPDEGEYRATIRMKIRALQREIRVP